MTTLVTQDFTSFVFASNDEIKTTSLLIAEKFGKTHAHVLRDIEKVISQVSDIFSKTNFGLTQNEVLTPTGGVRKDKMYELTKDGFIMVVMSYTGAKAFAIKEAYINAFNFMMNALRQKPYGLREKFICPYASQHQAAAPVQQAIEFIAPNQRQILEEVVHKIKTCVRFESSASWNIYAGIREMYNIESIDKLPARHFDAVHSNLSVAYELAKQHHNLLCQADKSFISNVLKKQQFALPPVQYGLLA